MSDEPFLAPRSLARGGTVAVIAPSGPFDREAFDAGLAKLRERWVVKVGESIHARSGYLAGSDDRRRDELTLALDDAEVDAILCARGGYGATRLLDTLDPARVRDARKLLVGFSDVTALHALWARGRVRSIHGPMVASLGKATPALVERFVRAVEASPALDLHDLETLAEGDAEGVLVGGNLTVLASMIGTPHELPVDGRVLFLEDIGERPYRVDRMLTTMQHAGWWRRARAVVLGRFTDCQPGADGTRVEDVLDERLSGLAIPVVAGVPAGHVDDNLELPFGARVRVAAIRGGRGARDGNPTGSLERLD